MEKKEKWVFGLVAGAGIAAIAYNLLSKDIPDDATPVQPFDKERYMGKWNEIARMPSIIEKNLHELTEEYSLNDDGTMKVVTRAINIKTKEPKEITGKIKFVKSEDIGMLKVSYFGPFYANYNVLDIDDNYQYALVSGSGLGFLWILSREAFVPDHITKRFLTLAQSIGFEVEKLEWMV